MYFKNWIFEHHPVCVALKYHMYCVRIFQLYAVRVIYTRMYTCFSYMLRISFLHLPGAWWLVWDHLPVSPQCSRQGRTKWMGGSCPYYVSCTWSTCKQSTCTYVSEPSQLLWSVPNVQIFSPIIYSHFISLLFKLMTPSNHKLLCTQQRSKAYINNIQ